MEDQNKEDDTVLPLDEEIRELFQTRRIRIEAKKKQEDDAKKAEQTAKASEKKKLLEKSDPQGAADLKYALMQKKLQQEARDNRARVLRRLEDDQAERKAREALRKDRASLARGINSADQSISTAPESLLQQAVRDSVDCAVQVRLFDGTTIKSRFYSHNTLREHVRPWIASHQTAEDAPYTFKQFLAPQKSRELTVGEEDGSLKSIGLTPTATLILVPARNYSTAFEGGVGRYLFTVASLGLWLLASCLGLVTGTLRRLVGDNHTSGWRTSQEEPKTHTEPTNATIRTLRDEQVPSENQQFYNGNSVSASIMGLSNLSY